MECSGGKHVDGDIEGREEENVPFYRTERVLRDQILLVLRRIIDPDLLKDIVACNFIKDLCFDYTTGIVSFTLELTTPSCPVKDQFVTQCQEYLTADLDWVTEVNVNVTSRQRQYTSESLHTQNVAFVIAVSSCKGGVGKSSMAVNLAFMLKRLGATVGLVDADVYGPSLNTLIPIENPQMYFTTPQEASSGLNPANVKQAVTKGTPVPAKGALVPLEHDGVKLMSYSYFRSESDAYAAVRGPIASSLVYQMVTQTDWGYLDYLIIDMPPGTGDVHLTLAQSIKITGAVVVTTPQQLALIDVEKGIHFFHKLNIPTLAVVENMAYIRCPHCGEKHPAFQSHYDLSSSPAAKLCEHPKNSVCTHGDGAGPDIDADINANVDDSFGLEDVGNKVKYLAEKAGTSLTCQLPLDPCLSAIRFRKLDGSVTFPFASVFDEDNYSWRLLHRFTQDLIRQMSIALYGENTTPRIWTTSDGFLAIEEAGSPDSRAASFESLSSDSLSTNTASTNATTRTSVKMVPLRAVRLNCRCAECVDEATGQLRIKARDVPLEVHALSITMNNNYAATIEWSDGHSSLLPLKTISRLSDTTAFKKAAAGSGCDVALEHEW